MEAPEKWVFSFMNEELGKFKLDEMGEIDVLLLGHVTYQIFADSWPSRTGELADRMNGTAKLVVSDKHKNLSSNNSQLVDGDVVAKIGKLKQESGKDILVVGSGMLARTLMQHDLIDEYRLLVFPIVLDEGKRLFKDGAVAKLKLNEAKAFDTGVVLLRYEAGGSGL